MKGKSKWTKVRDGIPISKIPLVFCVLLAVAAAVSLPACLSVRPGYYGDSINGRDAEKAINAWVSPILLGYDPRLTIGASHCPDRIDVSHGKSVECSVVVNGVALPVRVDYNGPPQNYRFNFPGSFFETRSVERMIESELMREHGLKAIAHCPGAPVVILANGTKLTCTLEGVPRVRLTQVTAGDRGMLYYGFPKDLPKSKQYQSIATIVKQHQSGKHAVIDGSTVANMIDDNIAQGQAALADRRFRINKAHCPNTVDLSGSRKAFCVIPVEGYEWRWAVFIDKEKGGTFHIQPFDALMNLQAVQQQTESSLNESLRQQGYPSVARINCGKGLKVVHVPGRFYCTASVDAKLHRLLVEVSDSRGTFRARIVDGGG